jgi:hypothetical protein
MNLIIMSSRNKSEDGNRAKSTLQQLEQSAVIRTLKNEKNELTEKIGKMTD